MTFEKIDIRGFEYLFSEEASEASGVESFKDIMAQIKALFPKKTITEILEEVNWAPTKRELKAFFVMVHSVFLLKDVRVVDYNKICAFGMLCIARLQVAIAGITKRNTQEKQREFAIKKFQEFLNDDTVRTYSQMINEIAVELTSQTEKMFSYTLVKKWLDQYRDSKFSFDLKDGLKVRPHFLKEIFK